MDVNELKIPNHVAIIMDGNGRWAKKKHMPRTFGHAQGAKVLEQTLEDANDLGVKYFTVYAFSTENWARPLEEVQVIMNLFRDYLISAVDKCNRNNVRCMVIGERIFFCSFSVKSADCVRYTQFPPSVDGVLIRAEGGASRKSCICAMAMRAVLPHAARSIAFGSCFSFFTPRYRIA